MEKEIEKRYETGKKTGTEQAEMWEDSQQEIEERKPDHVDVFVLSWTCPGTFLL